MGQLYEIRQKIEKRIKEKGMDEFATKGKIGMKSGVLLGVIKPDTVDDAEKISRLKSAAEEFLNEKL